MNDKDTASSPLLAAQPVDESARVGRLQAQLDGVMNCLAISQQEVEKLRARPDVWEQAILIVKTQAGLDIDSCSELIEELESARDAQQEGKEL